MNFNDELFKLIDLFNGNNVRYVICGGVAVVMYGYQRLTNDIDFLIQKEDLETILALVKKLGYTVEGGLIPFNLGTPNAQYVYRISKFEGPVFLTLDFMLVTPILQSVWDNHAIFELEDRRIPVVSLEGLGKMKKLAGRTKDILDLQELGFIKKDDNRS